MVAVSQTPLGCLLDSGIFIAVERRGFDLDGFMRDNPYLTYAMSSITAAELLIGARLTPPAQRKQHEKTVGNYFSEFAVLDFDIHCARQWVTITAELREKGQLIGAHDLLIAATALRHGYSVATFNAREFSRIPNLTVITP